jgi:hypothetical protein
MPCGQNAELNQVVHVVTTGLYKGLSGGFIVAFNRLTLDLDFEHILTGKGGIVFVRECTLFMFVTIFIFERFVKINLVKHMASFL